jgi:SAM-dependent methyltransferase
MLLLNQAFTAKTIIAPKAWSELGNGQFIQAQTERLLDLHCRQIFGDFLLHVGHLSTPMCFTENPLKRTLYALPDKPKRQNYPHNQGLFLSDKCHLSVAESSIDMLTLFHGLDFANDPHLLLREADRVLRSDGYLVLTGFNPLSQVGLLRFSPLYQYHLMKQARFFALPRVKEWLAVLGFTIRTVDYINTPKIIDRPLYFMADTYFIVAQKQEIPMSVSRPKFARLKPRLNTVSASWRGDIR